MKIVKQEVMVGEANSNDVVILAGLAEADRVHLSIPAGMEDEDIVLLKEMDGKRKKAEPKTEPNKKTAGR
jgi:hypothetical protein